MRIRWTPAAAADLQHINDYLRENTIRVTASRPCENCTKPSARWNNRCNVAV